MAEGLGSLSAGFLAGFETMNNYQRGKKADERADKAEGRADKAMSLREVESQRSAEHQQWGRDRTERRDTVSDDQWDKSHQLQKSNADQANKRGWAQLSLQQRRAKLSEQRENRQMQMLEDQNYLSKNAHIIQSIYNDPTIVNDNPDLLKVFESPAAAHLDPRRLAKPEMVSANKTIMKHFNNVVNMGANGELESKSDEELFALANPPEVTKALEQALSFELSKGIGDIDESTGKVIKKKQNLKLIPGPSGQGVVPMMEIVYEDGTKENKPATLGRGTDPGANVVEVPYQDLIQYFGAQGNIIKSITDSGALQGASTALGFTKPESNSEYRKAATSHLQEESKQLASVDKMLTKGGIEEDVALSMKQGIRQTFAEQGDGLSSLYNTNTKTPESPGDNFKTWMSNDPAKQSFAQEIASSGALKEVMADPERRERLFNMYLEEVQKLQDNESAAAIKGKILGNQGAQAEAPPQQPPVPSTGQTGMAPESLRGMW